MDPTRLLEADHRQVEELFEAIDRTDGGNRTSLIRELSSALKAHVELEETVLYPAMAPITGVERVEEGNTEHRLARKALAEMVALAPDDPGCGAAMAATKAGIEHPVKEEECTVFPQLRRDGSILERIATPFMQTRMQLGLPMNADALAAASSKNEPLAEVKNAGVDGASSMSEEELAQALARTMAS